MCTRDLACADRHDAAPPPSLLAPFYSPYQELNALQARIDAMEAQMATIEADIRAQVAKEHAAAIKAERAEADRRVEAKEAEIEEFKQLYAKEALARKKIHNKLLDIQCVERELLRQVLVPATCSLTCWLG